MNKGVVMGMDPSLNNFGISCRAYERPLAYTIQTKARGYERLSEIEKSVTWYLNAHEPELVAYEGYALGFRGKTNTLFDLGELGGIIKMLILRRGIGILCVPPTSLKLFTTGHGGGKSEESKKRVAEQVQRICGCQFRTSDEYDAVALMLMGEMYLKAQGRTRGLRFYQKRALDSCQLLRL